MTTYYTFFESPIGPLLLTSDGVSLTRLYMNEPAVEPGWVKDDDAAPFDEARHQLGAYFDGALIDFDRERLPLKSFGTVFQRRVWDMLSTIPYGVTTSYGAIAKQLGDPNGSRAVGLANGRNPISIIVPCHRVIGANGKLVGYGGGLPNKQKLLAWEATVASGKPGNWDTLRAGSEPKLEL